MRWASLRHASRGCTVLRRALAILVATLLVGDAGKGEFKFRAEEIETGLGVGYAVVLVDMNADRKLDIVVVDTDRVVWYENPTWKRRSLIEGQTKKDNVCIAPYDIDGDGKLDFALGADWRPADTVGSGTLQWMARGRSPDDRWTVHPIGQEPTVHRIRWADFDGDGRAELIVVPLFGRGSSAKSNYSERPLRILSYQVPADPVKGPWKPEVISEELHVSHNFHPADVDGDGRLDLLAASYEGVSLLKRSPEGRWSRELLHAGNQENKAGSRGASEIKLGSLGGAGEKYIATIEPWHGHQVAAYTLDPPEVMRPRKWNRQVLDDQLKWGHAVWCANLDGDKEEELIIGVRDNRDAEFKSGVRIYDPQDARGQKWQRTLLDPGGVAVEDLAAGDLNGDGRIDIVAVGRATHNVKIYWNEKL
jgi:hypothetical protein